MLKKSISTICTITGNTLLGIFRDKLFYAVAVLALVFLGFTLSLGAISLGSDLKIIKDLGLAVIYLFSLICAIYFGSTKMHDELKMKTYLPVVAKPVSRLQFLIGKYLGFLSAITISAIILQILYLILIYYKGGGVIWLTLWQLPLLIGEMSLISALTILFSLFTSEIVSIFSVTLLVFIGHSLSFIRSAIANSSALTHNFINFALYLLPDLEKFNLRNSLVYSIAPSTAQIIYPLLYSLLFTIILIWLSLIIFERHEK